MLQMGNRPALLAGGLRAWAGIGGAGLPCVCLAGTAGCGVVPLVPDAPGDAAAGLRAANARLRELPTIEPPATENALTTAPPASRPRR